MSLFGKLLEKAASQHEKMANTADRYSDKNPKAAAKAAELRYNAARLREQAKNWENNK